MKNLKIRTKILLGFGIAIAMLVIIVGVVAISNTQTSADLEDMRVYSDIEGFNTEFSFNYLHASIDAEAAHITKSDEIYADVIREIDMAYANLEDMLAYLGNDPSKMDYINEIRSIESDFIEWRHAIYAVIESNRLLQDAYAAAERQQDLLRLTADATYQNQQLIWRGETQQEDSSAEDRLRRAGRLDETVVFMRDIDALIRTGEAMYRTYDTSNSAAFFTEMDRVIANLQQNGDEARNEATRDTAFATVDALNGYRDAFYVFDGANNQNKAAIAEAQRLGDVAYAAAGAFSDRLSASVNTAVDRSILSNRSSMVTAIVVALVAITVAVTLALYISSTISKPLTPLTKFMKKAATTGDISFDQHELDTIGKYGQRRDEIGQCIGSIAEFINEINHEMNALGMIADGDLTIEPNIMSDKDIIGKSLTKVVENLNDMFGEINIATEQVTTGSKQIADGSQSLAQGSTEQAASIQQLSSSIAEIASRTKENAETAAKTSKLSAIIKENAEKGSRQMDEMIAAVGEINDASKNIGKIIKTIDDIAFQTNILALNAAVEAARAGQHGKGFAVVAEEVRNLASKSAEAAKDTGAMIQTSIDKAELGSRIAGETAASLSDIVSGINESSQLIDEIAQASEAQTSGISQINSGIDQVAQVVQQNSATAQESAAASEEMSGQSDILQQLIAQFRLKNSSTYKGLPSAGTVAAY